MIGRLRQRAGARALGRHQPADLVARREDREREEEGRRQQGEWETGEEEQPGDRRDAEAKACEGYEAGRAERPGLPGEEVVQRPSRRVDPERHGRRKVEQVHRRGEERGERRSRERHGSPPRAADRSRRPREQERRDVEEVAIADDFETPEAEVVGGRFQGQGDDRQQADQRQRMGGSVP